MLILIIFFYSRSEAAHQAISIYFSIHSAWTLNKWRGYFVKRVTHSRMGFFDVKLFPAELMTRSHHLHQESIFHVNDHNISLVLFVCCFSVTILKHNRHANALNWWAGTMNSKRRFWLSWQEMNICMFICFSEITSLSRYLSWDESLCGCRQTCLLLNFELFRRKEVKI